MQPIRILTSLSLLLSLGLLTPAFSQNVSSQSVTPLDSVQAPSNANQTPQVATPTLNNSSISLPQKAGVDESKTLASPVTQDKTNASQESAQNNSPPSGSTTKVFSLSTDKDVLKMTNDIQLAEKQVNDNPDNPEAHFLLAAAYSRSPYLDKAFREMKTVKILLEKQHDFEIIDKILNDYETMAKSSPDDPVVLYHLAMAYYFKGYSLEKYSRHYKTPQTESAITYYQNAQKTMEKVVALNPKDIWARDYLGYLVSDNGKDLSKAIGIWKASLAINKDQNAGAYLLLSQAYLQLGDIKNALRYGAKGLAVQQSMGMILP